MNALHGNAQGPADELAVKAVKHHRKVYPAWDSAQAGAGGAPLRSARFCVKLPVQQLLTDRKSVVWVGPGDDLPSVPGVYAVFPHQSGSFLSPDPFPLVPAHGFLHRKGLQRRRSYPVLHGPEEGRYGIPVFLPDVEAGPPPGLHCGKGPAVFQAAEEEKPIPAGLRIGVDDEASEGPAALLWGDLFVHSPQA